MLTHDPTQPGVPQTNPAGRGIPLVSLALKGVHFAMASPEAVETAQMVRDYIFVDDSRVRSRLSQLMGGVPDQEQGQRTKSWQAGFNKLVQIQRGSQEQSTETRSLSNLHASMLEDEASAAGMLPEVSAISSKEVSWRKNKFRKLFQPGNLFKIHAPTSIVAARQITELVDEFDSQFATGPGAGQFGDQVRTLLSSLYGDHLGIRIYPCGPGIPEKTFSGLFADVGDYIGPELPLLVPRFGSRPEDLTVIAQVTRVSTQTPGTRVVTRQSMEQLAQSAVSGDTLDRAVLETMLQQMLQMMESFGLLDSPVWPSIGVLPVAIYRNVAPVESFDDVERQLISEAESD